MITHGLNTPIGFTSSISVRIKSKLRKQNASQGLRVETSPGLYITRVPDPELSGLVVEFNITVTDGANKRYTIQVVSNHDKFIFRCEQFCLNQKSGSYKPCIRSPIKVSQYPDFSDPVEWSKVGKANSEIMKIY